MYGIYKHVKCNGDNVLVKHTCRYARTNIEKEKRAQKIVARRKDQQEENGITALNHSMTRK